MALPLFRRMLHTHTTRDSILMLCISILLFGLLFIFFIVCLLLLGAQCKELIWPNRNETVPLLEIECEKTWIYSKSLNHYNGASYDDLSSGPGCCQCQQNSQKRFRSSSPIIFEVIRNCYVCVYDFVSVCLITSYRHFDILVCQIRLWFSSK